MREFLFGLLLFVTMSTAFAETITIASIAPFEENSGASSNVKAKCKLETRIPEYIVKATKGDGETIGETASLIADRCWPSAKITTQ